MKIKYITILTIVAFLLHIIWENVQSPLYAGFQSFSLHFPMCFIGTVGDVVITLLVLAFLRLLKKDNLQTAADFMALAIIGFIIAVIIEQHALLIGKWNYAQAMPLVPYFRVGLTPILQMTILLPLSFYLTQLLKRPLTKVQTPLKGF